MTGMTLGPGGAAFAAYLRVYEPLAAFDGDERRYWEAYVADGRAVDREAGLVLERRAALRALSAVPVRDLPQVGDEAFVLDVDGVTLLCPWRTRVRALQSLDALRAELPDEVLEAFVSKALLEACDAELDRLRLEEPDLRVHVQCSPWQVPLRWFVLVDPAERDLDLGMPSRSGARTTPVGRRLLYRTAMSRARRRTARALDVLHRTVEDGPATQGVEEVARWLEEFHPRSVVELDYGGLTHLLDDAELTQEDSARDISAALAALADGEPARAAAAYARVTARSKALQSVESAN
jgi:hypothetical protein